ncbi:hypothetical protein LPJ59_003973 [Coemansia sp. RSA 2399]|nr:hypothetical protein LPJ59_003973 [Coemansia sp. RSA 2399]
MPAGDSADGGGPQPPQSAFWGFIQAHKIDRFRDGLARTPCAREGLLYGTGIGAGVTIIRFVKKGSLLSAGNWGVVSFAIGAIVSKVLCGFQRAHYHAKMNTLLEKSLSLPPQRIEGFKGNQQPPADDSSKK